MSHLDTKNIMIEHGITIKCHAARIIVQVTSLQNAKHVYQFTAACFNKCMHNLIMKDFIFLIICRVEQYIHILFSSLCYVKLFSNIFKDINYFLSSLISQYCFIILYFTCIYRSTFMYSAHFG